MTFCSSTRWIILVLSVMIFGLSSCDPSDNVEVTVLSTFGLISPQDQANDISEKPELIWTTAGEGAEYELIISTTDDLSNQVLMVSGIVDTVFQVEEELMQATTYYWSVTAFNQVDESVSAQKVYQFQTAFIEPEPSPGISKYYVSPTGVDIATGGAISTPFRTLAFASRMVPALENDTIFLMSGTYLETNPVMVPLGVNIIGSGVEQTIVKSSGVGVTPDGLVANLENKEKFEGSLIQLISKNFEAGKGSVAPEIGRQTIAGFMLDGMNKQLKIGIWVENRSDVILRDMVIKDCRLRGTVVSSGKASGTATPFLKDIKIHDIAFENSGKDLEDETLGNLCLGALDGAEIYNISIDDQEGYGIKFIFVGYYKNCSFHDIHTNLNEKDPKWGEKIAIELWNLGPGNEIFNVTTNTWLSMVNHSNVYAEYADKRNLIIHDVKIIDKDGTSSKEGIEVGAPHIEIYNTYIENKGFALALWDMGREDILIHNNIFRNTKYQSSWNQSPGVYIDNSRDWDFDKIYIYNNVFDMQNRAISIKGSKIKDIYIKNNLIIESGTADIGNTTTGNIHVSNNYKEHSKETEWIFEGTVIENTNIVGDPSIIGLGEFWSTYYKPSVESPLIDAGDDVGLDYLGSAPDIGFYESE